MNKLRIILIVLMTTTCLGVSAGYAPKIVQDSLKTMYPSVKVVGWSTDNDYYVGGFQYNGFLTRVWFDNQGHWVMQQTDWGNIDEAPTPVYHAFTFGPYSTDTVLNVTLVEFPNKPAQVVVQIGIDNALTQYQLFYHIDGRLINARNTTNLNNILGVSTFL